jgi:hypothetical protein
MERLPGMRLGRREEREREKEKEKEKAQKIGALKPGAAGGNATASSQDGGGKAAMKRHKQ